MKALIEGIAADRRKSLAFGLAGALIGGAAVALATGIGGSDPERERVEEIVRGYILDHPEILPQAMERLQARETAQVVERNRAAIETPFGSAWAGAEDGDVVLVEFFDYACGFCRASNADVDRLLREDPRLKVVWRELPVLGPDSETAALASLAAARGGDFRPYYDSLFGLGRPTEDNVARARRAAGVAEAEVEAMRNSPAARAEIEKNFELARALNASGTPTFVVGNQVLQGAVGYQALKEAIAEARSRT